MASTSFEYFELCILTAANYYLSNLYTLLKPSYGFYCEYGENPKIAFGIESENGSNMLGGGYPYYGNKSVTQGGVTKEADRGLQFNADGMQQMAGLNGGDEYPPEPSPSPVPAPPPREEDMDTYNKRNKRYNTKAAWENGAAFVLEGLRADGHGFSGIMKEYIVF